MSQKPYYRPAVCSRCGDISNSLCNPMNPGNAGHCGVRTPKGKCNGLVVFMQGKRAQEHIQRPKPIPADEADMRAMESELAQLERFQGEPP